MSTGRLGAGDTAIQPTIFDAKGDLLTATAGDTPARIAVGSNGQYLKADSTAATGLAWATLPASGKVLQVVTATYSTEVANSTSTYADTGLTASITPSSTSSKVLVLVSSGDLYKSNANVLNRISYRIMRGATQIFLSETAYTGAATELKLTHAASYLDSPNTTSSTIYKTQFMNTGNAASVTVQNNNSTSTITLLEIGA